MPPHSVASPQREIGRARLRRATKAGGGEIDLAPGVGASGRGGVLLATSFGFPGITICIYMKCGCDFSHARACDLVSKYRSTTMASLSARVRPDRRAAFRLTTAGPVSIAISSSLPKIILLPYGIFFGSTAQWPFRRRAPFEAAFG